jgi:hypothetical protein
VQFAGSTKTPDLPAIQDSAWSPRLALSVSAQNLNGRVMYTPHQIASIPQITPRHAATIPLIPDESSKKPDFPLFPLNVLKKFQPREFPSRRRDSIPEMRTGSNLPNQIQAV